MKNFCDKKIIKKGHIWILIKVHRVTKKIKSAKIRGFIKSFEKISRQAGALKSFN